MQVILLDKVVNLGGIGDNVKVKSGYARNYLIPQGKAVFASKENIEHFAARKAELEAKAARVLAEAQTLADRLNALAQVVIKAKAGEEGRLFGSINNKDIAKAITDAGVEVDRSAVRMADSVIRQAGEYDINLHLHQEVTIGFKVVVEAE